MPHNIKEGRAGQAEHAEAVPLVIEKEQQQVHYGSQGQITSPWEETNRPATVKMIT